MGSYKIYRMKDFIRKNETGELEFERSLFKIRELVTAADHHRNHNILIDLRETETRLNFIESLTLALEFAKYQETFRNKIAFLIPNDEERIRRAEFVKNSMVKLREFEMDYFTDYEKAIDWLSVIKEIRK